MTTELANSNVLRNGSSGVCSSNLCRCFLIGCPLNVAECVWSFVRSNKHGGVGLLLLHATLDVLHSVSSVTLPTASTVVILLLRFYLSTPDAGVANCCHLLFALKQFLILTYCMLECDPKMCSAASQSYSSYPYTECFSDSVCLCFLQFFLSGL